MVQNKRPRSLSNRVCKLRLRMPSSGKRSRSRDCQTSQSASSPETLLVSEGSSSGRSGATATDEIIHFDWHRGMYLGEFRRYEVRRLLGDGTFGRVLECIDHNRHSRVGVKVIRDVDRYILNAKIEARILQKLNEIRRLNDHPGGRGIVRLYDTFTHVGRFFCLSFEKLGKTLLEVIQMNNHMPFYVFDIQVIMREVLEVMDFLHARCELIHTDIKLENIMLTGFDFLQTRPPPRVGSDRCSFRRPLLVSEQTRGAHRSLRLIDFGNGVFRGDHHSSLVNTRQYRSPEVILEEGWDSKSDMWSVGCVLGELYTGELVFPTHSNIEHLAMIEKVVEERIHCTHSKNDKYFSAGRLIWPNGCESSDSLRAVEEAIPLAKTFRKDPQLYSVAERLLRIDPTRRYSASRALANCSFFRKIVPINE